MVRSSICRKFAAIGCGRSFLPLLLLFSALASVLPAQGQDADGLAGAQPAAGLSGLDADQQPTCVSRKPLSSTMLNDHSVEVGPVDGNPRVHVAGVGKSRSSQTPKELRRVYEIFAEAARKGNAGAQVNVAVASLAGWGTQANPGAGLYWLNEAARQGYGLAYFDLGVLYQTGCGVRQDYAEAARYFRLGAEANHAASQMNLGYLHDQGLGVARDPAQAAAWYRRAAEQGLAEAQFNLGDLYARGEGIERNEPEALLWFQKAALQGHTTAQLMLAAMCAQGRGTSQNLVMAYRWLTVARLSGDARAEVQLRSIEPRLTGAEVAEAKAQAAQVLQRAAAKRMVAALR